MDAGLEKHPLIMRYIHNSFLLTRAILPLLLIMPASSLRAWESTLRGTVMGSLSVDYSTGLVSSSVNTAACAFDGNFSTFFASYDRSHTWAGLDLGKKYVITGVGYASRVKYAGRLQLGVFEGANRSDFSDAIPLLMIKDIPADNVLVNETVRVSRGFRYVRYCGPNNVRCNIAEIRFYGHEGEGDDSQLYTPTNLPLVTVHTDRARDITDKVNYIRSYVSIISGGGREIYSDSTYIRGRGNATWTLPKKPYKLKLYHKTNVLGMPARAKKWDLLSNYSDKTLIRNLVAFRISGMMGMDYTPQGRLVDMMLNGEYLGSYQLLDHPDVNKHRVNITELEPEDTTGSALTGGYLVEIDAYASAEKKYFTTSSSAYNLPVSLKSPDADDITPAQFSYIRSAFSRMAKTVKASYFNNPVFGFRRYLDEDSFLRNFLVNETVANSDALWSVRMYKERDSLRFHTGPVWDFDLAFENDSRIHPVSQYSDFVSFTPNATSAGDMRSFTKRIVGADSLRLRELWSRARYDGGLTVEALENFVDSLTAEIDESQKLNFIRWPILSEKVLVNYQALGSYEAEVGTLRDFIRERIPWLDRKIGLIPVGIEERGFAEPVLSVSSSGISLSGLTPGAQISVYSPEGSLIIRTAAASSSLIVPLQRGIYIVTAESGRTVLREKVSVK